MRKTNTKQIALGGLLAAVAVVIMCLGGMIPLATYVCPVLCILTQYIVLCCCGKRIAWTWYGVVSILSALMGPDKEAAFVFVLLGYYPMIKPVLEKSKLSLFWKLLLFNVAVVVLYEVVLKLLGLDAVAEETEELGVIGLVILLVLGNLVFFLVDRVLSMMERKWKK